MAVTTELYAFAAQIMLQRDMDLVAGNIANASTPAYKREQLYFTEFFQKLGTEEELSGPKMFRDFSEGQMSSTSNTLDTAIRGDAFFTVETPTGVMYTRNGHFTMDADGNLTTSAGHNVLGDDGGAITFAPTDTDIVFEGAGKVLANGGEIATLGLVRFDNPSALERAGDGLYIARNQIPEPATDATVVQGVVEESNVKTVLEITKMMSVLRSFQSAQQMAKDENDRVRRMIQALTQNG